MHSVAAEYLHQVMVMQHLSVSHIGFVVCLEFFGPMSLLKKRLVW